MAKLAEKIGYYLILEKIAHGGMAEIYKSKTADPNGIERLVVIKRILPHISSHPEYIEMFINEAKLAVHFTHGNIAQVYDLGRTGDDYFIVMEYVDGKTFGQIIRDFKDRAEMLPLDIVLFCIAEICRGLDYIHRKTDAQGRELKVVHRDISPQNIILSYSGNVKIIDFGVAKSLDRIIQTESGVLKGKFAYMSPEQADGGAIDRRSDIFSAGTLLWEFVTLKRLFKRNTNPETVKAVKAARVLPPSRYRSGLTKELDRIVTKALQKKRNKRYEFASQMADDLDRLLYIVNPNFKPSLVTKFLYGHFGPEEDEEGLPPEFPDMTVSKFKKIGTLLDEKEEEIPEEITNEERTEKERLKSIHKKLFENVSFGFFDHLSLWWKIPIILGVLFILFSSFFMGVSWFSKGHLKIAVSPPKSRVYINNKPLTATQKNLGFYELNLLSGKTITLRVELTGYETYETALVLAHREKREMMVHLDRGQPPP